MTVSTAASAGANSDAMAKLQQLERLQTRKASANAGGGWMRRSTAGSTSEDASTKRDWIVYAEKMAETTSGTPNAIASSGSSSTAPSNRVRSVNFSNDVGVRQVRHDTTF
jgi:hypothetical protein